LVQENKLKQREEDGSKGHTMYQSNEFLKKEDKEIFISDNLEEVGSCRKQEGKDDRVEVRIKVHQSRDERNQQTKYLLRSWKVYRITFLVSAECSCFYKESQKRK